MKLDYIYFHVGRIAVNWANAEEAVDDCLKVFARALPDPLYQKPISTKRRTKVFRQQLKRLKITPEQNKQGIDLIDRFAHLAWYRHWSTHGTIPKNSFEGETWRKKKGLVHFYRDNISTQDLEVNELHLTDLEAMGDEALSIFADLIDWLCNVLGCSTPKKTEEVIRKIGVKSE